MRTRIVFVIACCLAALTPLLSFESKKNIGAKNSDQNFPGWPAAFDGRSLHELSLNQGELRFENEFPGKLGKFSDGTREIALRWVTEPTRMLHPVVDCLKGLSYAVKPQPLFVDEAGQRWGCVLAIRKDQTLRVRERIYDSTGQQWTDVSSWYWAALLGKTTGPWWAVTVAERQD